jgi:hypothetical protein
VPSAAAIIFGLPLTSPPPKAAHIKGEAAFGLEKDRRKVE